MAGKAFIADIRKRLDSESRSFHIRARFLVHDKQVPLNKNGNPYLALVLKDRDGTINAKMWDNVEDTERKERFGAGDFIQVEAEAQSYRGQPQLKIKKLGKVSPPQADELADFLGAAANNPERMLKRVRELLASLKHGALRQLLLDKIDEPPFREVFMYTPAAKTNHHAHLSGLLEHTLSVMELAHLMAGHYQGLNRDLLVAGAFLHDLGKMRELTTAASFAYSDEGNLIGHLVIGAQMLSDWLEPITEIDPDLKMCLQHMVLSHHGRKEYGSPVVPKFAEAMVLHFLDNLDSKVQSIFEVADRESGQRWSSFQRQFESYLFLGGPDPASAEENSRPAPRSKRADGAGQADLTHRPLSDLNAQLEQPSEQGSTGELFAADPNDKEG